MMTRQRVGRDGRTAAVLIAAGLAALAGSFLGGCSGSGGATPSAPSTSACWQAMVAQFRQDEATGATGTYPTACRGVPDAVLQDYAFQILSGNTGSPTP